MDKTTTFIDAIANKLLTLGYKKKRKNFILEKQLLSSLVKIRKHPRLDGYFIDFGIVYRELVNDASYMSKPLEWQLTSGLGHFDIELRKPICPESLSSSELESVLNRVFDIIIKLYTPLVDNMDNIQYVRANFSKPKVIGKLIPNSQKTYDNLTTYFNNGSLSKEDRSK